MAASRAQRTFSCYLDGVRTLVAEGAIYDSSDPLVKAHPDQFDTPESATVAKPQPAKRPTAKKV